MFQVYENVAKYAETSRNKKIAPRHPQALRGLTTLTPTPTTGHDHEPVPTNFNRQ